MSVQVTTLTSGLRVVTDAMPGLETASLGVWINTGSRSESVEEHGLAHLLEHMLFKGTRRRSARQIAEEIEAVGGDLNASTSLETTTYNARVLAGDAEFALDMLADMVIDSTFDAAEVEREKNVVIQEIGEIQDTPDDLVFELFHAAAMPDQPMGRPIIGTPSSVGGFTRQAIAGFAHRHHLAQDSIVAAAGAVDHERIVAAAQSHFARLPQGVKAPIVPARYVGGEAKRKRSLEQTHLVVGFEGVSLHDPAAYAAHVFAGAVGGGVSSRLFQEVRENRGLAYSIYAFEWDFSDAGLFGFYAAAAHRDVAEVVTVSLDCLSDCAATVTEAEVQRAKAQIKVSLLMALESSASRADQMARQLFAFGHVLTHTEIIGRIDAITVADVRAVGAGILAGRPTVAVVGKAAHVPDPVRIRERLGAA